VNQLVAARAGVGLAVLPGYLADSKPALLHALGPIPELATKLRLVTHKPLKGTARTRAFMELVGDGVRRSLAAELRPEPARAAG